MKTLGSSIVLNGGHFFLLSSSLFSTFVDMKKHFPSLSLSLVICRMMVLMCVLTICDSALAQSVKIVSYNIRLSAAAKADGDNCWERRRYGSLTMVRREQPDIIGLQEALPDQVDYLCDSLHGYAFVGVGRDDGQRQGEHMGVLYNTRRFRLLRQHTWWLSATPDSVSYGWDAACRRTVTYVLLRERKTGRQLAYLNTHLDHRGEQARQEAVLLLCRLIKEYVPQGVPVVLGGDMNSDSTDSIFLPLAQHHLLSARNIARQTDMQATFHNWGKAATVIDHFYVRGITPDTFQVLTADYGVPFLSDHYPIAITFTLR